MSDPWTCPDCAEEVSGGASVCPYCGYSATQPRAAGATRTARYGHCPSCGGSRWEGAAAGRCVTCGGPLQALQEVQVPVAGAAPASPIQTAAVEPAAGAGESVAARLEPAGADDRAAAANGSADAAGDPDEPEAITLLRQLARLRDDGIITAEEFAAKKTEILERL